MRLSPQTIEKMSNEFDLISPFQHSYTHEETNLSGGLSCAGYDVHLASLSLPTFNGEPLSNDTLVNEWECHKEEFEVLKSKLIDVEESLQSTRDLILGYTFTLENLMTSEYKVDDAEAELDFYDRKQQEIENTKNTISSNDLLANQQQSEIDSLKSQFCEYENLEYKLKSHFVIPPNGIVLGSTVEKFNIPKHLSMDYSNKSTLARRFIDSCATIAEPAWHGHLTLEIKNNSHVPQTLIIGQPIGQVLFQQLDHPTDYPYNGKYQGQSSDPKSAE